MFTVGLALGLLKKKKKGENMKTGDGKNKKIITCKFLIPYDPFDCFTDTFFGPPSYLPEPSDRY